MVLNDNTLFFFFICATVLLLPGVSTYNYSAGQDLFNYITVTNNYNKLLRPSAVVTISISFTILSVNFLDIKNQQFSANGWLTVEWSDARFAWNPASYDGITYMYLTDMSCWTPELVIDNSVEEISLIQDDNLLIKVSHDNQVEWEPPSVYTVNCDVDITYYPFDTQDCAISITSWSYDLAILVLEHGDTAIDLSTYSENGEWTLVRAYKDRVTKQNKKNSLDFAHLEFHFLMTRKSTYYVLNVLVPLILISFLGLAVFILPAESGEKVGYSLTVLLAQAVLMTIVANTIPTTSKNTSLLGIYLAINLMISTAETLLTVLVLRVHHQDDKDRTMSKRKQRLTHSVLARLTCRRSWCCCGTCNLVPSRSSRASSSANTETTSIGTDKETEFSGSRLQQGGRPRTNRIIPSDWDTEEQKRKSEYEPKEESEHGEQDKQYSWREMAEMLDILALWLLFLFKVTTTATFLAILSTNA